MKISALKRISRNVIELRRAVDFYVKALGFDVSSEIFENKNYAKNLGVQRVKMVKLRLGQQAIELVETEPEGQQYPLPSLANAIWFQHFAIVTGDIKDAYQRVLAHGATPISIGGPQLLPERSGGVAAFKFRDLDGHPLELLQFPTQRNVTGIDHSAIVVSDVARSIKFYAALGLVCDVQQLNYGDEQARLDGLEGPIVDVVSLKLPQVKPHLELLHYRQPEFGHMSDWLVSDIASDRLVFEVDITGSRLIRDPDGHVIILEGREALCRFA